MLLPTDAAFWIVVVTFVSALATSIITVLRALTSGKIVVGRHYEDALRREESWREAAETAIATVTELSGHLGRLTGAMEQATATMREAVSLVKASAPPGVDRPVI